MIHLFIALLSKALGLTSLICSNGLIPTVFCWQTFGLRGSNKKDCTKYIPKNNDSQCLHIRDLQCSF